MAVSNGTGQGGKSFQDRELAARVRTLALTRIEEILKRGKGKLYDQVIVRLSGTVLPKLNEHTGEDGHPIVIEISPEIARQNGIKAQ